MQKEPPSVQAGFSEIYEGTPPWDTGRPQPPFLTVADKIASPVLDVGCGTGSTSVFLAERGHRVTGIDFVEKAIRQAKEKAARHGVSVDFLVKDAMTLGAWDRRFSSVIDSGLFHIYEGEDLRRYVSGLARVIQPGGRLYLYGFSDEEPAAPGGGVSESTIRESFADGWEIVSIESIRGEISAAFTAEFPDAFPKEGPMMRFAIIARKP